MVFNSTACLNNVLKIDVSIKSFCYLEHIKYRNSHP